MSTKLKMVGVRLDEKLARELRYYAAKNDTSVQDVVKRAIVAFIKTAIVLVLVAACGSHGSAVPDASTDPADYKMQIDVHLTQVGYQALADRVVATLGGM